MNDPLANTLKRTREPEHPEEPGAAGTRSGCAAFASMKPMPCITTNAALYPPAWPTRFKKFRRVTAIVFSSKEFGAPLYVARGIKQFGIRSCRAAEKSL